MKQSRHIAIYIVCVLAAAGCSRSARRKSLEADPSVKALEGDIAGGRTIVGVGLVLADHSVSVMPLIDGAITQVCVRGGEAVKRGQVLFKLDPHEAELNVRQAAAIYKKDADHVAFVEASYKRYVQLFLEGVISRQDIDSQRADLDQSRDALNIDALKVQEADLALTRTVIKSPIRGYAGLVTNGVGDIVHVANHESLVTISDARNLKVLAALSSADIKQVRTALSTRKVVARIKDDNGTTSIGTGTVESIDASLDKQDSTGRIVIRVATGNSSLFPNEPVTVEITESE